MSREACFIFIDESISNQIDTASLTGVVISISQFEKVRSDFYKICSKILYYLYPDGLPCANQPPPVLHGVDFLRKSPKENKRFDFSSITDEFRLQIFNDIINLINEHELFVVRQGYKNVKEILKNSFHKDNKLHDLNWFNISRTISNNYRDALFIPVMDGVDNRLVREFCYVIHSSIYVQEMYPELAKHLSYHQSNSFISPVFFSKAEFTEGIQIADVISYLLHKAEYIKIKNSNTPFSLGILNCVSRLRKENLINYIGELKMNK